MLALKTHFLKLLKFSIAGFVFVFYLPALGGFTKKLKIISYQDKHTKQDSLRNRNLKKLINKLN